MQPIAETPPIPYGRAAVDAWRELNRETRRELLRSDQPHPDPAVAVVAVGYAREVLSRSPLRQRLPFATAAGAVSGILISALVIAQSAAGVELSGTFTFILPVAALVLSVLLWQTRMQRRAIMLHRMERLNAARLWSTEGASPAPPPMEDGATVVVRYSRRAYARSLAPIATIDVVVLALVWPLADRVTALLVTALLVVSAALLAYLVRFRVRPHLPMLIMNAAGLEIPSMRARLTWPDVTELQIHPYRAQQVGMKTGRHSVAFVLTDPDALTAQLTGWWAKRVRTSMKVYGTPLVIRDAVLDHTAEQIAAAAAFFAGAPIRRFGP